MGGDIIIIYKDNIQVKLDFDYQTSKDIILMLDFFNPGFDFLKFI